jgi:hypothetical protein
MPTLAEPVKFGEDADIEKAPVLSEEEKHTLKKRMEVMDTLLRERKRAKFKVEVMFGSDYKSGQPYAGAMSWWLSGSRLSGGGDDKVYECPGCAALLLPSNMGYGFGVCGKCGKTWKGAQLVGEKFAKLTTQNWVTALYAAFRALELNADFYMKRTKLDVRRAAGLEQERQRGGERLMAARRQREVVVYPLYHLIKDVSAGSSIPARIRAFLEA